MSTSLLALELAARPSLGRSRAVAARRHDLAVGPAIMRAATRTVTTTIEKTTELTL